MLIEFKIGDHQFNTQFSMLAAKDDSLENNLINYEKENMNLLKSSFIYGDDIILERNIIFRNLEECLDSIKNGSTLGRIDFQILFTTKGNKYSYGFTWASCELKEEYLYSYPNGRQTRIFERTKKELIIQNDKNSRLCNSVKEDTLFLSMFKFYNDIKFQECIDVYNYLADSIQIFKAREQNYNLIGNTEDTCYIYYNIDERISTNRLIKLVNDVNTNENKNQMIACVYNPKLMDLNLLRRDQIWFMDKNEKKGLELYSLSEFKGVRKDENIERGYLQGKYGIM